MNLNELDLLRKSMKNNYCFSIHLAVTKSDSIPSDLETIDLFLNPDKAQTRTRNSSNLEEKTNFSQNK